ncbi:hypothetical protein LIER_15714 [Lithospermum erythrorhizon]|uniref:Uncharacterized protein n=1 Tax=Lithospermum erythrorhizon TaxID=34254 RepID=A0AAV3Q5U8_LITER
MSEEAEFEGSQFDDDPSIWQISANGVSMQTTDVEVKIDEGNIQEAESALREGLSLNFEEARALLGKLEYQRGNLESALRVFDGIDLQAAIQRMQPSLTEKQLSKKGRARSESNRAVSQHAASLILEAVYLKAKSLQKLGKLTEAAHECKNVLDAVEKIFYKGITDVSVDCKLQEIVSQAVELLPELFKQAGSYVEAMSAYRRALLSHWNLENDCCARIQKDFAVFLLYSGVEVAPPSLAVQVDGSYVPRNNLEEAILLLMILIRKAFLGKSHWDPSVFEHLTFALSICSQTCVLGKQLEEVMPGILTRSDRWKALALCYSQAGDEKNALNMLRKSLHQHEDPNDVMSLLLAAKICSGDSFLAAEGVSYARRAITNAQGSSVHLKGIALRMLGLCLGKQAKIASSDSERSHLQSEALKSLDSARALEPENSNLIFDIAFQYAEHRNLNAALRYAKQYIDATGGSILRGWRLLALVLSAQQHYSEAEIVIDAALDETAKWNQGSLLRMKAKLRISQSRYTDAIETYRYLLALVQAQKKSYGPGRKVIQKENDKVNEYEVWHDLANLYTSLSHWEDAEICLNKAKALVGYSEVTLHTEGIILERRGKHAEALTAYVNSIFMEPTYVPTKISLGSLLGKGGTKMLPVARNLLSDALRLDPTSRMAWFQLGLVHRDDGRLSDAADCFQAASMLEESDPVESFSSIH